MKTLWIPIVVGLVIAVIVFFAVADMMHSWMKIRENRAAEQKLAEQWKADSATIKTTGFSETLNVDGAPTTSSAQSSFGANGTTSTSPIVIVSPIAADGGYTITTEDVIIVREKVSENFYRYTVTHRDGKSAEIIEK